MGEGDLNGPLATVLIRPRLFTAKLATRLSRGRMIEPNSN